MISIYIGDNYPVNMGSASWLQSFVSSMFPSNIVADATGYSDAYAFTSSTGADLVVWAQDGTFTYVGGSDIPLSSDLIGGFTLYNPQGAIVWDVDGLGVTVGSLISAGTTPAQISTFVTNQFSNQAIQVTHASTGADTVVGFNANDILYGNGGNDTLDGRGGIDDMFGGTGNDTYIVDHSLDDAIENASEGTADLVQSSVSYLLGANVENLTLTGTSAINGQGNSQNNILTGNNADNLLDGGAGADTMSGLLGNDIYVVDNAGDVVTESSPSGGTDMVQSFLSNYTLLTNVEYLVLGGTGNINGTGNTLDNALTGNSGNNVLDGGTGADYMAGGAGNDTYKVDNAGDATVENPNEGTDTVETAVQVSGNYVLAPNLENLTLTGSANLNGAGNDSNNVVTGNAGNNVLDGGLGNDTLVGNGGDDSFLGRAGADAYDGGAGMDTAYFIDGSIVGSGSVFSGGVIDRIADLLGTVGETRDAAGDTFVSVERLWSLDANVNDSFRGTSADDVLVTGGGDDDLVGRGGADVLDGGDGFDTVWYESVGGRGLVVDWLLPAVSTDDAHNDILVAIERIYGAGLDDKFYGGNGNEHLAGGGGDDLLDGRPGDDQLDGGPGNDTFIGGLGRDVYIGQGGNDRYIITSAAESPVANPDIIVGFETTKDKLDLTIVHAGGSDSYLIVPNSGNAYVYVDLGGNGTWDMAVDVRGVIVAADLLW